MDRIATRSRRGGLQASRPWGRRLQLQRRRNLEGEVGMRRLDKLVMIVLDEPRDRFGELVEMYAHVPSSMTELARDVRLAGLRSTYGPRAHVAQALSSQPLQ